MSVPNLYHRLFDLIKNGKAYELAGLKDVPKPFMKSQGRFLEKEGDSWNELDDEKAKKALASAMVEEFKVTDDLGDLTVAPYKDWKEMMERPSQAVNNDTDTTDEELIIVPQAKDAILLECVNASTGDKMYEQQGGNKTIFNLASQLVTSYTTTCEKRVEAALILLKGFDEAELHDEDREKLPPAAISKTSRFLVRTLSDDHEVKWAALEGMGPAEFAVTFVFEVFLEKGIHNVVASSLEDIGANLASLPPTDTAKPGTVPVDEPTDYDVLFGRGGMTNSHPGNRRFRDIIALHRPDYIRAIKMDKPGVARKIVKAIRFGSPPGRYAEIVVNFCSRIDPRSQVLSFFFLCFSVFSKSPKTANGTTLAIERPQKRHRKVCASAPMLKNASDRRCEKRFGFASKTLPNQTAQIATRSKRWTPRLDWQH